MVSVKPAERLSIGVDAWLHALLLHPPAQIVVYGSMQAHSRQAGLCIWSCSTLAPTLQCDVPDVVISIGKQGAIGGSNSSRRVEGGSVGRGHHSQHLGICSTKGYRLGISIGSGKCIQPDVLQHLKHRCSIESFSPVTWCSWQALRWTFLAEGTGAHLDMQCAGRLTP
jgi:hypothetical protein